MLVSKNGSYEKTTFLRAEKGYKRCGFFLCKFKERGHFIMKEKLALKERIPILYWSLITMVGTAIFSLQLVLAADDTIWTQFTAVLKDIYGKLLGISTIVAVVATAVALLVRMISRNQRAVDEATSWIKRILITWIILNTLGFIIAYLQGFVSGGRYTV